MTHPATSLCYYLEISVVTNLSYDVETAVGRALATPMPRDSERFCNDWLCIHINASPVRKFPHCTQSWVLLSIAEIEKRENRQYGSEHWLFTKIKSCDNPKKGGQSDGQAERQMDRHTGRQSDGQAERQAERQMDRQIGRLADRQQDRQISRWTDRLTDR